MKISSLSADTGAKISSRKRKLLELVSRKEQAEGKTFAEAFSSLSQLQEVKIEGLRFMLRSTT